MQQREWKVRWATRPPRAEHPFWAVGTRWARICRPWATTPVPWKMKWRLWRVPCKTLISFSQGYTLVHHSCICHLQSPPQVLLFAIDPLPPCRSTTTTSTRVSGPFSLHGLSICGTPHHGHFTISLDLRASSGSDPGVVFAQYTSLRHSLSHLLGPLRRLPPALPHQRPRPGPASSRAEQVPCPASPSNPQLPLPFYAWPHGALTAWPC